MELFRLAVADEVPEDAWRTRLQWTSAYKGVPGLDDTFIHLSTAEQVVDTAAAYFAGNTGLVLLRFSAESMQTEADLKIKWAPAHHLLHRSGVFTRRVADGLRRRLVASPNVHGHITALVAALGGVPAQPQVARQFVCEDLRLCIWTPKVS